MDGPPVRAEDDALDATSALLAPAAPSGTDERPGDRSIQTQAPHVAALVGRVGSGSASIDRVGDVVSVAAPVGLREVLAVLPAPAASFVATATEPDFLDTASVSDAIDEQHRATALVLALLACEGVVTLVSRSVPYDLPLAALVVGSPPPPDTAVVGLTLSVGGELGAAIDTTDGPPIMAVARRTPAGQVLVAMSGVAPGPVLVRDPAEQRRPGASDDEVDRASIVHRRAIEHIGTGRIWVASAPSGESLPAPPPEAMPPDRPALLERRPGEATIGHVADVVVDHHHGTPGWRWIGRPRPLAAVRSPLTPPESVRVAVVEVAGHDEIEQLRRIDDVVAATIVAGETGVIAVGLLATTDAALRRAMTAAGAHLLPEPGEGTTLVETIPIVGSSDDGDDTTLFETFLRIDAGRDARQVGSVLGNIDDDGRIVVSGRLSDPFALRRSVARSLGVPAGTLRMVARPGPGTAVPDTLVALVARTVQESGRPVTGIGTATAREARALTVSSTLDDEGVLDTMQVQSVGTERSPDTEPGTAVAWAAEIHRAARARSIDDSRDDLLDVGSSTRSMADAVARVQQLAGFERRGDVHWSSPTQRPGVSRGIGLAIAPPVAEGRAAASATVTWAGGSSFVLAVSAGDTVAGLHLALAQIAAEILGSAPDDITVIGGDTDRVPPGEGTVDAGFAVVARAVKLASDDLRRRIARRAARRLGTDPSRIELLDGAAVGPDGATVSFDGLGTRPTIHDLEPLVGYGSGTGAGMQAGGVTAVVIEVERSTGMSSVLEMVTATCAGVVVNPLGAGAHQRAELIDAAAEALGRPITEAPLLTTVFVEEPDDDAPCGARSLGGVVRRSVLPAIHAAIFDATGVELDIVPFSASRLRSALLADR